MLRFEDRVGAPALPAHPLTCLPKALLTHVLVLVSTSGAPDLCVGSVLKWLGLAAPTVAVAAPRAALADTEGAGTKGVVVLANYNPNPNPNPNPNHNSNPNSNPNPIPNPNPNPNPTPNPAQVVLADTNLKYEQEYCTHHLATERQRQVRLTLTLTLTLT